VGKKTVSLNKKNFLSFIGYIPVTIWVAFTFVLVGWVFCASFATSPEIFSDHMFSFRTGIHFENYIKAWKSQNISVFFFNSLLYTLISCTAIVLIASPAAYALARFRFTGNTLIQNMFAAALGIPVIMIVMPLFGIATSFRLTNNRWVMTFLYTGMNVPFAVFYLLAFFKSLSTTYEEAAAIDGCSPIRTFWRIMFPLIQPALVTLTIFVFIIIWNEYFMGLIFANRPAVRPVAVGLYQLISSMRYTGDWAGMFAGVVIVCLPTFLLYVFLSDKIIKGVTAGAIKG
jgi:N-acetylglucosamine transport system permease protein